jgi:hypothetical protein
VTVEAFYVMHLPVNEDKVRSIEDALDTFTHAEIIPGVVCGVLCGVISSVIAVALTVHVPVLLLS